MHGGFDARGRYRSPRTALRRPAIVAWSRALRQRGEPLVRIPDRLYSAPSSPNIRQQIYLLRHGVRRPFHDALTATAEVERRAGRLCTMQAPDYRLLVAGDLDALALGHLNLGLLEAHGMDEGGNPADPSIGAHDRLWLIARDILFSSDVAAVEPEILGGAKMESGILERRFEQIPLEFELSLRFFLTILLSEARADLFFDYCAELLTHDDLFDCEAQGVREAAAIIRRIRCDEIAHVGYLRVLFSELRAAKWRSADGRQIVDALWDEMVDRQTALEHEAAAARGAAILAHVESLERAGYGISMAEYRALAD